MDCSPSGSSVHGILQARTLEWGPISFPRGSSQPRDQTSSPTLQADSLPSKPPEKPYKMYELFPKIVKFWNPRWIHCPEWVGVFCFFVFLASIQRFYCLWNSEQIVKSFSCKFLVNFHWTTTNKIHFWKFLQGASASVNKIQFRFISIINKTEIFPSTWQKRILATGCWVIGSDSIR